MNKQPSRTLIEATLEAWRFHLTFQIGEEVEDIRVWVERSDESLIRPYFIQRSVQHYPQGHTETENATGAKIAEGAHEDEVQRLLKELFYLWTRDDQVDTHLRPLLQQNLQRLREPERGLRRDDGFAYAKVYIYDVLSEKRGVGSGEIFRYAGKVPTKADLRQIVLELSSDFHAFEIHLEVSGQIVGNASYWVINDIDEQTGKRSGLLVEREFGACKDIHDVFGDLYNTEEEFNRSVGLTAGPDG